MLSEVTERGSVSTRRSRASIMTGLSGLRFGTESPRGSFMERTSSFSGPPPVSGAESGLPNIAEIASDGASEAPSSAKRRVPQMSPELSRRAAIFQQGEQQSSPVRPSPKAAFVKSPSEGSIYPPSNAPHEWRSPLGSSMHNVPPQTHEQVVMEGTVCVPPMGDVTAVREAWTRAHARLTTNAFEIIPGDSPSPFILREEVVGFEEEHGSQRALVLRLASGDELVFAAQERRERINWIVKIEETLKVPLVGAQAQQQPVERIASVTAPSSPTAAHRSVPAEVAQLTKSPSTKSDFTYAESKALEAAAAPLSRVSSRESSIFGFNPPREQHVQPQKHAPEQSRDLFERTHQFQSESPLIGCDAPDPPPPPQLPGHVWAQPPPEKLPAVPPVHSADAHPVSATRDNEAPSLPPKQLSSRPYTPQTPRSTRSAGSAAARRKLQPQIERLFADVSQMHSQQRKLDGHVWREMLLRVQQDAQRLSDECAAASAVDGGDYDRTSTLSGNPSVQDKLDNIAKMAHTMLVKQDKIEQSQRSRSAASVDMGPYSTPGASRASHAVHDDAIDELRRELRGVKAALQEQQSPHSAGTPLRHRHSKLASAVSLLSFPSDLS